MKEAALYNDWKTDLNNTQPFVEILQKKLFSNSILKSIEKSNNEVLMWLDKYSGIDYVVKTNDNNIVGVAARIQYNINYRTFTIRTARHTGAKTEYEKRVEAINKGYFYPAYTLQAYFNRADSTLIGAAIIETKKLYQFIEDNPDKVHKRSSDNEFIFIKWDDIDVSFKEYNVSIT